MSIDEKLFGLLYRAARRAFGRAPNTPLDPASVAFLDCASELGIIASALAERRVLLRSAADSGAIHLPHILLPERMSLSQDPTQNTRCYLARVVFDATVVQLGLTLKRPASSAEERLLATLLAAPAVLAQLDKELPAARALLDAQCGLELVARNGTSALDARSAALEALVQQRLGRTLEFSRLPLTAAGVAWYERARAAAPASSAGLAEAMAELWPFVRGARVLPMWLWGGIDAPLSAAAAEVAANAPDSAERSKGPEKTLRAQPRLRRVARDPDPREENPLVHSFEKVHTADEYRGGNKRSDGSDELAEHSAALDELEVAELTRTDQTASGMIRAEFELEAESADTSPPSAAPEVLVYDEWDERTQRYRADWCSVYVVPPVNTLSAGEARRYVAQVLSAQRRNLRELSAELARVRNARTLRNRQSEGPDVDIDALVDRNASLRSGHSGPDKLYMSRRRHCREFAVLLLLDASLSTDAWVAGQRVLDVAKSALIVLGEVFGAEEVPTAIATFSSQTRKRCNFSLLKTFEDGWQAAQPRVVSVEPAGYTRIGPALRHASQLLSQQPAPKRLLVLISDAKPTDYDRYEGRYGHGDVRKAIAEAQAENVSVFTLAIDARAAAHLPAMFERGRYQVLSHPDGLARALAELYVELLR